MRYPLSGDPERELGRIECCMGCLFNGSQPCPVWQAFIGDSTCSKDLEDVPEAPVLEGQQISKWV